MPTTTGPSLDDRATAHAALHPESREILNELIGRYRSITAVVRRRIAEDDRHRRHCPVCSTCPDKD